MEIILSIELYSWDIDLTMLNMGDCPASHLTRMVYCFIEDVACFILLILYSFGSYSCWHHLPDPQLGPAIHQDSGRQMLQG